MLKNEQVNWIHNNQKEDYPEFWYILCSQVSDIIQTDPQIYINIYKYVNYKNNKIKPFFLSQYKLKIWICVT